MVRVKNVEEALIEGEWFSRTSDKLKLVLDTITGDVWFVFRIEEYADFDNIVDLSDYIRRRATRKGKRIIIEKSAQIKGAFLYITAPTIVPTNHCQIVSF